MSEALRITRVTIHLRPPDVKPPVLFEPSLAGEPIDWEAIRDRKVAEMEDLLDRSTDDLIKAFSYVAPSLYEQCEAEILAQEATVGRLKAHDDAAFWERHVGTDIDLLLRAYVCGCGFVVLGTVAARLARRLECCPLCGSGPEEGGDL
jgi:hypothetical protein